MEDVIIVGAGPTGLWAAAELALAGLSTVVIERSHERSPHSKALGLHARTLEILAMRNLIEPFLAQGRPMPMWHFGMLATRLDLRLLDTPYPYMLAIPQRLTEELIERRALDLGVRILRGREVTGLQQDEEKVALEVDAAGERSTLNARFVIGADGGRSTVRALADIGFSGTDGMNFGYIGEVTLDAPPSNPVVSLYGNDGAFITIPLGAGRYRLAGFDPHRQQPGDDLTLERLRDIAVSFMGSDLGMRDPTWLTRFSDQTRLADNYRNGRVFLAGDAAHITWPTGGVGLNVGIQDAMNLSWKLASAIHGRSDDRLLSSYNAERRPVGQDLVEHTLAQGALITATTRSGQQLRALMSDMLLRAPGIMQDLAAKLSGLEVDYADPQPGHHQLVGRRVPNLRLADGRKLFEVMEDGRPVRLANAEGYLDPSTIPTELGNATVVRLAEEQGREEWIALSDAIVRPDGHLGWARSIT
ncbi:FAD-binding protein [Rhizobium leguminosarum]|uniref:FAD-dependent oxidoreductase n=1 Tax=Rhizobium TaxID=379 RepID=UPI001031E2D7|nr:FAD-dependent oxidoreductase [Rhizobium leguminosarum]TBF87496.1 FAD-binding protein [Rhizobium leguminosarum]TBG06972.1 FAD-binding protein [Rhizobium leguminosarum]TBG07843.1 FAD-binding protein [Rhizobium leguminosarum]TBG30009.1 FAD-binding protein [Rhizobium leguminosarum]TBG50142.1 FAD-binding protein [Rhizobium leguminosarum]